MKYSAIFVSALISTAWAIPQQSAAPSTTAPALPPTTSCILACNPADVNCQAKCIGAAHPNSSQVVETNECAARCDQGDGSPAASDKFSQCVQSCIASHFPTSQTVAPARGSNSPAQSSDATDSAGATITGTPTAGGADATGTGAAASSSGAASLNNVQMGAAGLAGFFMAIFAL